MPAPTAGQRPRPHAQAPAEVPISEKAKALAQLLQQTLADLGPDIGGSLGEVVATVAPEHLPEVARRVKESPDLAGDLLWCLSLVDYQDRFEAVYHVYSTQKNHRFVLKAGVSQGEPHLPSVMSVWPGADWYEREAHDLFGVVFEGHPNLAPLLLYEGFEGYPGRRSYPFYDYQEW
ncbi:MAG: NADH-quinone oxidoreductase subunit C [Chloroflexi bacterium]|nr:NADH-quinone oxidoreductase subunit C [Chloroflexota bacterium]